MSNRGIMQDGASGCFVFIESNTTGTGQLCVQRARRSGFRILFLTSQPELYPFLSAELIAPCLVDTTDADAICALLQGEGDIAAVMSTSEYFIEMAAQIAARLSLVGPDVEAVRNCRHKGRFARILREAGVGLPETFEVNSPDMLGQLAEGLSFPVVVKPVYGSGSVGVQLVSNAADLRAVGGALLSATRNERGLRVVPGILVQRYVSGDEYSVEMFSANGRDHVVGYTRKHLGPAPFFVETGHDFPARLDPAAEEAIRSEVLRALQAVGYCSGPSHVECRLGSDGRAWIIEINPRLAGGMIPRLVELARGVDLLGALIDFFAGRTVDLMPTRDRCAAIRFLVADRQGAIEAFHSPVPDPPGDGVDAVFTPIKRVGAEVQPPRDFRDRLAYVIAASDRQDLLDRALASMLERRAVQIGERHDRTPVDGTGRIRRALRPEALDIIAKPPAPDEQIVRLDKLAAIDEAHLGMLVRAGILSATEVAPVLAEIDAQRADRYAAIAGTRAPRGIYVLYEDLLIARLGERAGAVAHTARSRNDIHACVFKLEARELLTRTFHSLWRLRASLLAKAAGTMDVVLAVYSQFQPGQPGTLAYYLWSVDAALRRDQRALLNLLDDLQVCPMGAGTGAGTDFPILPQVTADLLGFSTSNQSALDAVASRDLALRLLGAWAVCSTVLSRLAQDLQIWSMADVGFLELPDDLAGGSSMMPQKKNPYLLEIAKGKLVSLPSAFGLALHATQKTPFSNAMEVGTTAVSVCAQAAVDFAESCDLLRLMVEALVPQAGKSEAAARKGAVIAGQIANALVRERHITFHEAHRMVRARIAEALEAGRDPLQSLRELSDQPLDDLHAASHALMHGGGPGIVARQLADSEAELRRDADVFSHTSSCWIAAETRRRSAVQALIASATSGREK